MTTYLIQVITAGIASFGFALLYNVRGKRLIIPFTGGHSRLDALYYAYVFKQ